MPSLFVSVDVSLQNAKRAKAFDDKYRTYSSIAGTSIFAANRRVVSESK